MILVGCKPKGRFTEQHDVFFGIAESLKDLVPHINQFWPDAANQFHIDAWREVTQVNGYAIEVLPKGAKEKNTEHLFFINLGGYKPGEFDEFHYKLLTVAAENSQAISAAKKTAFYITTGFKGATSHIDDKYSLDVDDIYNIEDMLSDTFKQTYSIHISMKQTPEDELHLGYLKLSKLLGKE